MSKDEERDTNQFNRLAYMTSGSMNEKRMETAGKLSFDLVNML